MAPQNDIERLARQADEALSRSDLGRRTSSPRTRLSERRTWRVLAVVLSLVPLLFLQAHVAWVDQVVAFMLPTRALQGGQADMRSVLGQARAAVEAARATTGDLPAALPSAALAALVRYERQGASYRLSMSDRYSVATMDSDGQVEFQVLGP